MATVKKAKKTNAVILFGDEVSFAMWAPRGKQPVVKTTGIRKGLKRFGAIEFNGGHFQYMEDRSYSITAKSIKADGVPENVLDHLKSLKNDKYKTKADLTKVLEKILGKEFAMRYHTLILKHTQTTGKFNGESYVEFLKPLVQHFKGKIILIEEGAPYHNNKVVTQFITGHKVNG